MTDHGCGAFKASLTISATAHYQSGGLPCDIGSMGAYRAAPPLQIATAERRSWNGR